MIERLSWRFILTIGLWMVLGLLQSAKAQEKLENLLHLSHHARLDSLATMKWSSEQPLRDTTFYLRRFRKLRSLAEKQQDKELAFETMLLELEMFIQLHPADSLEINHRIGTLIDESRRILDPSAQSGFEMRVMMVWADYQWFVRQNPEFGLNYLLKKEKSFEKNWENDPISKGLFLYHLASRYYFYRQYSKAIPLFQQLLALPETYANARNYNSAINTLGLAYQKLNRIDSSSYYFNLLRSKQFRYGGDVWRDIAAGNLGYNYFLQKKYEQALPLVLQDYRTSIERNDPGSAGGASVILTDLYLNQGQLDKAKEQALVSRALIDRSGNSEHLGELYQTQARIQMAEGNTKLANQYMDSAIKAVNALNRQTSSIQFEDFDFQAPTTEVEPQASVNPHASRKGGAMYIGGFLVLVLAAAWLIWRRRKRPEVGTGVPEAEGSVSRRPKASTLVNAVHLPETAVHLPEKSKHQSSEKSALERSESVDEMKNHVILTDDDWGQFQIVFEEAYPGLQEKMRSRFSELSEAELRYLMLAYMSLTHREMASMLGISPDSLRVTWHRIRRKLHLPIESTPIDLFLQIP